MYQSMSSWVALTKQSTPSKNHQEKAVVVLWLLTSKELSSLLHPSVQLSHSSVGAHTVLFPTLFFALDMKERKLPHGTFCEVSQQKE